MAAVSGIVTGVVWRWLERPEAGINLIFQAVGLGFLKSPWYTDADWGILAVSVAGAWQFSGYVMALYLAGLRGIFGYNEFARRVELLKETPWRSKPGSWAAAASANGRASNVVPRRRHCVSRPTPASLTTATSRPPSFS